MKKLHRKLLTTFGVLVILLLFIDTASAVQVTPVPSLTKPILINALAAPSNLNAVSETPGTITLTWEDNSTAETGFMVERRMENTAFSNVAFQARNSTTFVDSESGMFPIYPGEKYYYRVRAYNDTGESAYSNEAGAIVKKLSAPSSPSMLKAQVIISIMGHPIQLTWDDNSSDETIFVVQRQKEGYGFEIVKELPPNTKEYMDSSELQEDVKYTYRIEVFNDYGSSYSNYSSVSKPSYAPGTPQGFTGIALNSSSIRLFWIDTADNEDEFWIVNKNPDGTYSSTPDYVLEANTTELIVSGLKPETDYRYIIISKNAGFSSFISETKARTGPPAPINLSATGLNSNTIRMTWDSNSMYTLCFTIERKTDSSNFAQVAYLVNPEELAYADSSVSSGQKYTYRVQAWNGLIPSDYSSEVTVTPKFNIINPNQIEIRLNLGQTSYFVNNEMQQMDTAPIISEGRTMLPIRYVTEALGAQILWDNAARKVTIIMDDKLIELWIDNNAALVNGQEVKIDPDNAQVKPFIMPPGRAMLPLRFISENLGCQVDWDPLTREAKIILNNE